MTQARLHPGSGQFSGIFIHEAKMNAELAKLSKMDFDYQFHLP
jgi:hypothetical protein